ncbi:hypothetical protein R5R35_012082 [Gryllus longicercus]|uniref:Uncharacterized protein n=1 Tax=Gryllus longicercus TaxID=2509291 RepID=A0AAN9VVA0_9ORTH
MDINCLHSTAIFLKYSGEIPAAHRGPMITNPLSAAVNSLPGSQIPTTPNSTLQKGVNEATANPVPATEAEAPALVRWFAH